MATAAATANTANNSNATNPHHQQPHLSEHHYDYLVIGGGSGGVSSAKRAAGLHGVPRVAIVEGAAWGGTCVNVGCVPKKIWFQAAAVLEAVHVDAAHYEILRSTTSGIAAAEDGAEGQTENAKSARPAAPPHAAFDWKALKRKRDAYIQRLNAIYLNGLKAVGVTILEGWGSFVDPHTVLVTKSDGTTTTVTADKILIATGGKPMVPTEAEAPGVTEHCITSDGFFALEKQPETAVVVGAGYIAVELAGVLNALGTKTHLVLRKGTAIRTFDPDVVAFLDGAMVEAGVVMHRNTGGVARVDADPTDKTKKLVTTLTGEILGGMDCVLMAPGRVPNVDGLNLEKAGVKLDRHGRIAVDEYQTCLACPHVFAVGDVCSSGYELTPVAIAAGRRLADRLFGKVATAKISYENVPTVVFSHPTIGTIGLTEPDAVAKYGTDNLTVYRSTFVNLHYSMYDMDPADKPKTLVKIICAGVTEQVVGLHICGKAADEMLQGFGVAIKMGATKADLDACIAIHPTASEELVTLGTWGTSPPYTGSGSGGGGNVKPLVHGSAPPEPHLAHPVPPVPPPHGNSRM